MCAAICQLYPRIACETALIDFRNASPTIQIYDIFIFEILNSTTC